MAVLASYKHDNCIDNLKFDTSFRLYLNVDDLYLYFMHAFLRFMVIMVINESFERIKLQTKLVRFGTEILAKIQ